MPSKPAQLDKTDIVFLAKRTGFILLGALVSAILLVWVPFFEELQVFWAPIMVAALTTLMESLNRFIQDYQQDPDPFPTSHKGY